MMLKVLMALFIACGVGATVANKVFDNQTVYLLLFAAMMGFAAGALFECERGK